MVDFRKAKGGRLPVRLRRLFPGEGNILFSRLCRFVLIGRLRSLLRAFVFGFRGGWFGRDKIDPFDERHLSRVAWTWPQLDDARVAAIAAGAPGSYLREQLSDGFDGSGAIVVKQGKGAPTGMETTSLGQSDHFFGQGPDSLCLGESRLDAPMLDKAASLIGEQSISMLGRAAQLNRSFTMTHNGVT
jgi:hypothetical protein